MEDFVAYPSRWRLAFMALGSALFVVAGLWLIGAFGPLSESSDHSPILLTVTGWISIIFFGLCGVIAIKRMLNSDEVVRISSSGIISRLWSDQMIPWSEITNVSTWSHQGQKVIILKLRDPARFPGKSFSAMVAKANRLIMDADVSISMTGTDRSYDEAMTAIYQFTR